MSAETAVKAIVEPLLATLTPVPPYYWGIAPEGVDEYVGLSNVNDSNLFIDDFASDDKQLTIVTRLGMLRAGSIRDTLKSGMQRYKGVVSGVKISSISIERCVDLPDPTTGESKIAIWFRMNYEGGL
ncbi:MAG: hypothetical protein WC477_06330 [Patescibacteria group bacterium]